MFEISSFFEGNYDFDVIRITEVVAVFITKKVYKLKARNNFQVRRLRNYMIGC